MLGLRHMSQSNLLGRALEYIIVETLNSKLSKNSVFLNPRVVIDQKRDSGKFEGLTKEQKEEYLKYSELVFEWLNKKFNILKAKSILIDRIPDNEAMAGDVTDIRITIEDRVVNLSIKHNHFALKHQRPPSLAIQCGFLKNSKEDVLFRQHLLEINKEFHSKRNVLLPNAVAFNELKKFDSNFIDDYLYKPTCLAVVNFINKYLSTSSVNSLFSFLVGNKNFYKIVASKNSIQIKEFADIVLPEKVEASIKGKSYVTLNFSNGWVINMRLHTASTLITTTPSLKFDTQAEKMNIPEEIMNSKK